MSPTTRTSTSTFGAVMAGIFFIIVPTADAAQSCDSLAAMKLPETTVTAAQSVAAGAFSPPGSGAGQSTQAQPYRALPAFCRVTATLAPSSDSDIKIEVWMPAAGWNGKFQGVGNGGFAGSIGYGLLAAAVSQGYAAVSTDTGHVGGDANFAVGHPEKVIDFGYRAIHEMTDKAKAIVAAFYGRGPERSYFSSCSNGGRQALMEAERYPADYDGIIAGAPANFWTRIILGNVWNGQAMLSAPGSHIPASKLPALERATAAACDARDGVTDGVLDEPLKCRFDPSTLLCKGAESDECFTAPQIEALKKIYSGGRDAKGQPIFPGYPPGAESGGGGWGLWITGQKPGESFQLFFSRGTIGLMTFADPKWDPLTFDFNRDLKTVDDKLAPILNATNPDLRAFKNRGGKLIIYHGWNDAAISAGSTVDYYNGLVARMGANDTGSFVRLYMVPGMQHCSGGPGATSFGQTAVADGDPESNIGKALERWVERGVAPSRIIATKYKVDNAPASGVIRTRPLCPYPQVAVYNGSGSTDEAANFTCKTP
jgi:feruloyl esterase